MSRISKEHVVMEWAKSASKRSSCSRLHVGSILMDKSMRRVLSWGYNGGVSGNPNRCESDEPGNCGCIHSEINCLISSEGAKERDMVMFVTDSPCLHCAKCIINAGVTVLYYSREYRIRDGLDLLESKIQVHKI